MKRGRQQGAADGAAAPSAMAEADLIGLARAYALEAGFSVRNDWVEPGSEAAAARAPKRPRLEDGVGAAAAAAVPLPPLPANFADPPPAPLLRADPPPAGMVPAQPRKGGRRAAGAAQPWPEAGGAPLIPDGSGRYHHTWNEDRGASRNSFKRGPWSKEEDALLQEAFANFCADRGLTEAQRVDLLVEGDNNALMRTCYKEIGYSFQFRSLRSIHKRASRLLHPHNYKGTFTEEEIKETLRLVKIHGERWKEIGRILERHPNTVRNQYLRHCGGKAAASSTSSSSGAGEGAAAAARSSSDDDDDDDSDGSSSSDGSDSDSSDEDGSGAGAAGFESVAAAGAAAASSSSSSGDSDGAFSTGRWTDAEKARLLALVRRLGTPVYADEFDALGERRIINYANVPWMVVSREHGTRSADQCRNKWTSQNYAARALGVPLPRRRQVPRPPNNLWLAHGQAPLPGPGDGGFDDAGVHLHGQELHPALMMAHVHPNDEAAAAAAAAAAAVAAAAAASGDVADVLQRHHQHLAHVVHEAVDGAAAAAHAAAVHAVQQHAAAAHAAAVAHHHHLHHHVMPLDEVAALDPQALATGLDEAAAAAVRAAGMLPHM